jgi:hypothetical protein
VVSLGKYGSPESRQAHARLCAELAAAPEPTLIRIQSASLQALTIDQVLLAFWRWAETHYRSPDGQPTSEIQSLKKAVRKLRNLSGRHCHQGRLQAISKVFKVRERKGFPKRIVLESDEQSW